MKWVNSVDCKGRSVMTEARFGSTDLALPENLREALHAHLRSLREAYLRRGWAGRVGFGERPAVVVIDMACFWLDPQRQIGSNLDVVLDATCKVLHAARAAQVPIFFTSFAHDSAYPPSPHDRKLKLDLPAQAAELFQLDPRLGRLPNELLIRKRYASAFKATALHEMLTGLGID